MSSETADVYEAYLGLSPGVRPPHFYDLLELELLCSHLERINSAVRKQYRKIKPFEDHPDRRLREAIQDVMTQLATARAVLTDPVRKERYDAELSARLGVDRDELLRSRTAAPVPDCELRVTVGPSLVGTAVDLVEGADVTIGQDPHCVLHLLDPRVKPRHAVVRFVDQRWTLFGLDRHAVILVNDHVTREFVLADDDRVDVGGFRLRFRTRTDTADALPASAPPPLSLIVCQGPATANPVLNALSGEEILIGNSETALWHLPDLMVSRHHCRVFPEGNDWHVEDVSSTNGTFVNGRRVERCYLRHHDQLQVGHFDILVNFRA